MATAFTGKRTAIKIGTGVLTRNAGGEIHHAMIARLSQAIADINAAGHEVIMVSSGAVGAGMSAFCLTERPTETNMLQACAAAGQARLMHLYEGQFGLHGLKVHVQAQCLRKLSIPSVLAGADMLILLTSVAGLMGPDAKSGDDIIPLVDDIESVLSFVRDEKGALSVGGMASKLRAVEAAVSAGIETLIASGLQPEQLPELVEGRGIATRFVPKLAKNP